MNNELYKETSPYLLQHKDNPVHWVPWSEHYLAQAKNENKLLIISIGYAACHWCHVMEHECFENDDVAKIMNDNYVSIKVDREERPDIDKVYMNVAQLMNGSGGWPLNVVALPDGTPIFAGTYFPKENWVSLLNQIATMYSKEPKKLLDQADSVANGLQQLAMKESDNKGLHISHEALKIEGKNWLNQSDKVYGGYKRAPKFVMPSNVKFLLNNSLIYENSDLFDDVKFMLDNVICGGINDIVSGGFARYSVDSRWHVPHFEKMLYDNGQLLSLISHLYRLTNQESYQYEIEKVVAFLDSELRSNSGGYYSSLNADSEGAEGTFYVWTIDELEEILGDDLVRFCEKFHCTDEGNWEHRKNVIFRSINSEISNQDIASLKKLEEYRNQTREKPSLDNKIIVSWNALTIIGLCDAYIATSHSRYLDDAISATSFVLENLVNDDNVITRVFNTEVEGLHDDYALLIQALIKLYTVSANEEYIVQAKALTDKTIELFYDEKVRLFLYTRKDGEKLIVDSHEVDDNVIPGSNSVMAENLFILSKYFYDEKYTIYKDMLAKVYPDAIRGGIYYANWLNLAQRVLHEPHEIVVNTSADKERSSALTLLRKFKIEPIISFAKEGSVLDSSKEKYREDIERFYVCKGEHCLEPVKTVEEVLK